MLEDPLRTRPPVLDTGPVLPGDEGPVPCPSRVDLDQPLALGDAVDLALCHSPRIKAAWAAIKIQAGAVGEARAAYLPTLTGSIGRLRTRTQHPDFPASDTSVTGQNVYAGFNWRLLDFGGRNANREAANLLLRAALSSHDAALQKTLSSVAGAYFDALTAQGTSSARAQAALLAQDTLAATQRRLAKGAAGQSDTLQAATALAKARLAEQRALGEEHKALAVLAVAIGLPNPIHPRLAEQAELPPAQAVAALSGWLAEAEQRHPALRAARAQAEAARAKVVAVRAEGMPTLDWSVNFYQNGFPNQGLQPTKSNTRTIGVTLTIPFFEGFSRTYKIRGAQAQVEQSEAQQEDTEQLILSEVAKAHADAVAARENLAYSDTLLAAAEAALDSARRRYAKGAADILELLAAQAALADAQQEQVRCRADWRSARLRLMANTGILGRLAIAQ
jgi:outer membrane protein